MKQDWKPGTLIYPLPAVLVSCGSDESEYNILTVAWTGTICTNPPMCYISVRPEQMKLTPGKCSVVNAPLIEESPLCIECRVKEIVSLGSHDMFISDVVNIRADDRHLNRETGKLELAEANPLVYVHGGYYNLGEKIGKFGWSVEKKTK